MYHDITTAAMTAAEKSEIGMLHHTPSIPHIIGRKARSGRGMSYGAQKLDRLMRVLNLSIIAASAIMVTGWLIAMFLPYYCARMFTTDKQLIDLGIKAIRVVMFCFPVIGFQMVITNFFQCIGKVKISIFLSLSRQLLILLPLLAFLPMIWDIDGVWYSMPISDFSAAVIAGVVMVWYMNKLKRQHQEQLKVKS